MTRQEHLDWCKQRALAYLPGDLKNAFTSMLSDLGKHPETKDHFGIRLGMDLMLTGNLGSEDQMRRFIEGFN